MPNLTSCGLCHENGWKTKHQELQKPHQGILHVDNDQDVLWKWTAAIGQERLAYFLWWAKIWICVEASSVDGCRAAEQIKGAPSHGLLGAQWTRRCIYSQHGCLCTEVKSGNRKGQMSFCWTCAGPIGKSMLISSCGPFKWWKLKDRGTALSG